MTTIEKTTTEKAIALADRTGELSHCDRLVVTRALAKGQNVRRIDRLRVDALYAGLFA